MPILYGRLLAAFFFVAFTIPALAQVNLTMPSASDTMVGRATTDTLTNKTIASGIYSEAVVLSGTLTPTALSGNVNDYNPTNLATATALRIDGGAADRIITGLAGGADGRLIMIVNIGGTNTIRLSNGDAGSSAANRFQLADSVTLPVNGSIVLRYDGTSSRWRPFGRAVHDTGATAGSYTCTNLTVGIDGRLTAAANGSCGGGSSKALMTFSTGSNNVSSTNIYFGTFVSTAATSARQIPVPYDGTVSDLICSTNSSAGGANWTFTLNIDGTDNTNQQVTGTGTATFSSGTNTGIAVTRGQKLTIHFTYDTGTPTPATVCTLKLV